MTIIDPDPADRTAHVVRVVREWWPVPALVGAALVAHDVLLDSRYDVGGHAAEHLASAGVPFLAAAAVSMLFWATPRARRQADLLAVAGLWLATTMVVMVGNLRVVDDLIAAGYAHTPTDSVPGVADHALANSSVYVAELAGLLLVLAWRRRRHVGGRATIWSVIITVVVPPWVVPGAGVLVLAFVRLVRRGGPAGRVAVPDDTDRRVAARIGGEPPLMS